MPKLAQTASNPGELERKKYHEPNRHRGYLLPRYTNCPIHYSATPPSTPGFTPSPTPSPTASHSAEPTQVADPNFGIGLGASSGPESLLIWRVHEKGEVSWKEPGGEWQTDEDEDRPFNIAPTVVATAEDRRAAFAVDQRGLVVYALYQDDAWDFEDGWTELGTASDVTKFGLWRRPTAVSRAEGLIDVFAIDAKKQIVHIHFDGDDWGEWKLIGRSFTGVVSVTTWGKDRLDIFATSDGGAIKHTSWTPDGWAKDWDDLGEPASIDARPVVSPMAVSFEGSDADGEPELQIAVVLTVERRGTFYRLYSGGEWDEDWVVVPASHEGYEFSNTQAVVGGPPEAPVNLFSRGTDNCLHYNSFNGTKWLYWHYLWCYEGESGTTEATYYPTRHLPVAAVLSEDNTVEVVQANVTNELFRLTLQLPLKEGSHVSDWTWDDLGTL